MTHKEISSTEMTSTDREQEISVSLLDVNTRVEPKSKRRGRCFVCIVTTVVIITLLLGLTVFICFADAAKKVRCFGSKRLSLDLRECEKQHVLQSLSNTLEISSNYTASYSSQRNTSCQHHPENSTTASKDCGFMKKLTTKDLEYIELAETTWKTAWRVLNDKEEWNLQDGTSLESGRVFSKTYTKIGRVSKLEGYVDTSPEDLFEMVVTNTKDILTWNPALEQFRVIYTVTSNTDIIYVAAKPVAKGLISPRYYVNLRHWKSWNNMTMSAETATSHSNEPTRNVAIRAVQGPSGMLFQPVPGNPDKCLLVKTLIVDIGGWIPQWIVDEQITASLMDFLSNIREKVEEDKKSSRKK